MRWVTRLAALIPVSLVVVDPASIAPSGTLRWSIATVVTLAAYLAVLAVRLVSPRSSAVPAPARSGWVGLLAVTALATVLADDRLHAFAGTPERRLGLTAWVVFAAAFAVGGAIAGPDGGSTAPAGRRGEPDGGDGCRPDPVVGTARAVTVAGAIVVALAGVEAMGLDPTGTAWPGGRVGAPFAQPTYLAAALVLCGPVAAGVGLDRSGPRWWRRFGAVTAAGSVVLLALTQARGPVLGLAVAVGLAALARWRRTGPVPGPGGPPGRPRSGRGPAAPVLAGGAVLAVVLALVSSSLVRGWGSVGGRLDEWRVAARAVADRPLLGGGPESYRIRFWTVVDADYVRSHGADVLTDRAHQALLDTALGAGIPAAVLLCVLSAVVVVAGWRHLRGGEVVRAATTVGVLAYLFQQQVLFPLAELDPLFWLLAGMVVVPVATAAVVGDTGAGRGPGSRGGRSRTGRSPVPTVAVVAAAVGVVAVASATVTGSLAEIRAEHRLASAIAGPQRLAPASSAGAVALAPGSVRVVFAAARIQAAGPTLAHLDRALTTLETGLANHPDDPALRFEYAARLLERARRSGLDADVVRATTTLAAEVDAAPTHPGLRFDHASALALGGDPVAARVQVARAALLAPGDPRIDRVLDEIERA